MRTNVTMLYGHIETIEERVDHLLQTRGLQDDTGGLQAFIPLAFRPRAYEVNMQDFAVMYDAVLKQSGRYKEIRLPTLVIAGDADEIVWTDLHSRCFSREVPGAEWATSGGCGTSFENGETNVGVGCGMGHVPARSRRFLHFYTLKPSIW